jgi:hypothetical protein
MMGKKLKFSALIVSLVAAAALIGGVTLIGGNKYPNLDRSQKSVLLSVVPGVTLTKYNSEKHGAIAASGDSSFVRTAPYLFVFKNESGRAITGVTLRWSWPRTGEKKIRQGLVMTDSYFLSDSKIGPEKELLIGPQSIASLAMAKNGKMKISAHGTGALDEFDATAALSLSVDAVIFENGEILGPDLTGMGEKLRKRNNAVAAIVSKLKAGVSIEALAMEQSAITSDLDDPTPQILRVLQSSKRNAEALVLQLERITPLPRFHKGEGQ